MDLSVAANSIDSTSTGSWILTRDKGKKPPPASSVAVPMTVSTKASANASMIELMVESIEGPIEGPIKASIEAGPIKASIEASTEASTVKASTVEASTEAVREERTSMLHYLLSYRKSGVDLDKLIMGALKSAAMKFHCTTKTVARIW